MKKTPFIIAICGVTIATAANAAYSDRQFRAEVTRGLDIVGAHANVNIVGDAAPGELGYEVYETVDVIDTRDYTMFIPTSMYVRGGGGLNLGFATDKAQFDGKEYESSGSWTTQIGLGWNLSSYVRTEIDFQESTFKFSDLKNRQATYQTLGGMLYFDLARRYVHTGDITRRRTFVPFIGVGAGLGHYAFEGTNGADGFVIAAPRAQIGFNVALTDLIGIDIAYQYQMMIGNGFGWDTHANGTDNISNIMASMRVNF
ncbi:porin family protein [bacterium]|nr:porin family protein [bacterium]